MKPAQMDAGTLADGWGQSHHLGLHEIPRICSSELLGKICVISVYLWLKVFISHRFHRWTQIKCYLLQSEIYSRDFMLYLDLSDRTTYEDVPPTPHNVTAPREPYIPCPPPSRRQMPTSPSQSSLFSLIPCSNSPPFLAINPMIAPINSFCDAFSFLPATCSCVLSVIGSVAIPRFGCHFNHVHTDFCTSSAPHFRRIFAAFSPHLHFICTGATLRLHRIFAAFSPHLHVI